MESTKTISNIEPTYICLDVETPNLNNDSVCQIGLVYLDSNLVVYKTVDQLIDPHSDFSDRNIEVHGIHPEDVRGMPSFDDFWNLYGEDILNTTLVCHNYSFDLVVIDKNLKKYGKTLVGVKYIDTKKLCECDNSYQGARCYDSCVALGLETHTAHNALCDAIMCFELFAYYARNKEICLNTYIGYNIQKDRHQGGHEKHLTISKETEALRELLSFMEAIICDDVISQGEIVFLYNWFIENTELKNSYQYQEIFPKIQTILEDGKIDKEESDMLCSTIKKVLNPKQSDDFFINDDVPIEFNSKTFVITGQFTGKYTRSQVKEEIVKRGGKVTSAVSKKTDYLVVGSEDSEMWKSGNYGQKIESALKYQTKIISEEMINKAFAID